MTECLITDEDGVVQGSCGLDDVFRLLANARRREIVAVLDASDANWIERDRLLADPSGTDDGMEAIEARDALHHVHLPMLEDLGLIEYDRQSGAIRYYQCQLLSSVLAAIDLR